MTANNVITSTSDDDELIATLQASLYPGASPEAIRLVVSYCRHAQLDIMTHPVHLVPMRVKDPRGQWGWRDVIMPGINSYRVTAARTGCYAGQSEPEFGPAITRKLGNVEMTFPEWCRIIVRRALPTGAIGEFVGLEFWMENYATSGRDSAEPNAMWRRRPYGQLAKCAEAQALRRAFPDAVGAQPTFEEMQGRDTLDPVDVTPTESAGSASERALVSLHGRVQPPAKVSPDSSEPAPSEERGPVPDEDVIDVAPAQLGGEPEPADDIAVIEAAIEAAASYTDINGLFESISAADIPHEARAMLRARANRKAKALARSTPPELPAESVDDDLPF